MADFNYEIVQNPEKFQENRLPARADYEWYGSIEAAERGGRSDFKHLLNGIWWFSHARNYESAVKDFYRKDYDCRKWEQIRVPAHIQTEGYGVPQYANTEYPWDGLESIEPGEIPRYFNPVASYVKYFTLPKGFEEGPVYISFQGAESGIAVWCNGEYVGYSEDSFTPSDFDLTPFIDRAGENKLAVMVFRFTAGSWCEDQDFFRFSGLFRDVYLYTVPKLHINDMRIITELSSDYSSAKLKIDIKASERGDVRVLLSDQSRDVIDSKEKLSEDTKLSFQVSSPALWSAEIPNLYDLTIEVYDPAGRLCEVVCERVGFREFKINKDHIMCINGKRVVFRGVNRHEFSSENGRVISEKEIRTDLINMKQNNINAIRTSHYPNRTELYRLCDEFGIYVIDETNLETHGTWDTIRFGMNDVDYAVPGNREEYAELVLDRARNLFERDKNRPSVVIWSLGNEAYGGKDIFEMHEAFHRWDDTRPVHYEGIFWDKRYPATSDIASSMYEPVTAIKEYLKTHRDKPYINCEYSHAMANSCGAIEKYTRLTEEEELFQGGFIWDYIDQSMTLRDRYGRQYEGYGGDFGDFPNDGSFSGNGIAYGGEDRAPSPKMQEVKYVYQNLRIEIEDKQIYIKNMYLFLDAADFSWLVTVEKEGKVIDRSEGRFEVPPLSEARVPLPVDIPDDMGEFVVTVSARLKEDTPWAKAGHELAWGQTVCGKEVKEQHINLPHRNSLGYWNAGIQGEEFSALFSKLQNGLTVYSYGGRNLLAGKPRPNFWRSMTENDQANLLPFRAGQWKLASMYLTNKEENYGSMPAEVTETEDGIKIVSHYYLATKPVGKCSLTYLIHSDGVVDVELSMDASEQIGELPEFSVIFTLDADYENLIWYGKGPEETYQDRDHAKLGVYEQKVADIPAKYLVPQESGNKTAVRWAKLLDRRGRGICFYGEDLSVCVSPYTPHELDNALHPNELPPVLHTYVRVGLAQMGIAGDDTWGAKTHPEYMIDNSVPLTLKFSFKAV
ncbi:MAG: DUF4981 domain-containing protein [Lachnospiraceae bacterium]|nr:DUF4981 domain-containing protein [Lachnospiraceae bacterium]